MSKEKKKAAIQPVAEAQEKTFTKADETLRALVSLSCEVKKNLVENFGEMTWDTEQALIFLEKKLPNKADGYKFIIDDLNNEAALWKKRSADFAKVAKSFQTYADNMENAIKGACIQMGVDEISGEEYRWKLQRSKPTVIIDDEQKIPSGHKIIVQTTQIKKDSILEDLKSGVPVPGAHLEESIHVRCYANTAVRKKGISDGKPEQTAIE